MKLEFRIKINTQSCIGRFNRKFSAAQVFLDNQVLKDCASRVPMQTGNLMNSGVTGTIIGSGTVQYKAPYAKPMYYGVHFHFSKDKHPLACAQWFEVTKAIKKKDWINGVDRIMKG